VLKVVKKEFRVYELLEKHKHFGYRANHYIISLDTKRTSLNEYKRFYGLKCEVQVKTLLQHAWAEIEHDIGYKPGQDTAWERSEIRKDFSKNAQLLGQADKNFVKIRKLYEKRRKKEDGTNPKKVS